ncbi:unnamed protein product, partial [marine sediment metagenome]
CDYAPLDINDYGTCYCNLYFRSDFYETVGELFVLVPERRPVEKEKAVLEHFKK